MSLSANSNLELEALVHKGKGAARKLTRARILLKADASPEHGPAWTDDRIKDALDVGLLTIQRLRQSFVEEQRMIDRFGSERTARVLQVVASVLQLHGRNPENPKTEWLDDPLAHRIRL